MQSTIAKKWKGWGVLIGVPALFVAAFIYARLPAVQAIPLCAVNHFLGVDCPGCGMTRSVSMLTLGAIRRSVDLHPLGIIVACWLVYKFFQSLFEVLSGRRFELRLSQSAMDILLYAFIGALFLQWFAKLAIFFYFSSEPFHPRILDMLKLAA